MRVGVKPGVWGWSLRELAAFWAVAEEAGFGHLSCFDHPLAAPAGLRAWDAPALLQLMATKTERLTLCVDVLIPSYRNPVLLAGQIAVALEVADGRVEVGLGIGRADFAGRAHAAMGVPFPPRAQRLARVEALCTVLPALWRGETVSDQMLGLDAVSLGPVALQAPPIFVGGASDEILSLVARCADGWHNAQVPDAARFGELRSRLLAMCEAEGRTQPIRTVAQLQADGITPATAAEHARAFAEAGADALTFLFMRDRDPEMLRRIAEAVLRDPH